jgi:hypothetical protein
MSFAVFEAGSRRTVQNWAAADGSATNSGTAAAAAAMPSAAVGDGGGGSGGDAAALPADLSGYSPDQVKLVCLSQVRRINSYSDKTIVV